MAGVSLIWFTLVAKTPFLSRTVPQTAFQLTHPSSLGLHPAVYFYSSTGRYQPTAFLATVAMLRLFEEKDRFREFTKIRRSFEDFLLKHRILVNQLTVKNGSATKGYARLQQLLIFLVDQFLLGHDEKTIVTEMARIPDFSFQQRRKAGRQGFRTRRKICGFSTRCT